jgi:hypothetical protein
MTMAEYNAYNDFWGTRADGVKVKAIIPQFDGSSRAGDNCAPASEAARDIRDRQGVRPSKGSPWPPTGASIRNASSDRSGGMTPRQTAAVSLDVYGLGSDVHIATWREIIDWLRAGGSLTLLVKYRAISAAGKSGSPGFYGSHSIPLCGIKGSGSSIYIKSGDPLYDGRRRGIPLGPQWIKLSVLRKAATDLILSGTMTMADKYPGKAYTSFGLRRYTPPPSTTPVKLYPKAIRLKKPRIYTPTRKVWMRKTPKLISSNHIGTVTPGFNFEAYQYIINADGKWIGNRTGTAWLYFSAVKFVRYIV